MLVRHEGHVCELQLNCSAMLRAKRTKGHRDFEIVRELGADRAPPCLFLVNKTGSPGGHGGGEPNTLTEGSLSVHEAYPGEKRLVQYAAPLSLSDKLVDAVPSRVLKTVREFVRNFVEGGGGAVPDPATTTTSNDGSPPKIPWVVTTRPWNEQG